MPEALGRSYAFSHKPRPALISTGVFDEDAIRNDLAASALKTRKN